MREKLGEPPRRAERDGEVPASAPLRVALVERMLDRADVVAERLEQPAEELLAPPRRQDRDPGLERDGPLRELRALLAAAAEGRTEHARDGDAQERRRHVGPVVHVLRESPALARRPVTAPDEPDRVDVEQQRRRATLRGRLRKEDVDVTEGQLEGMQSSGILG